MLGIDQKIWIYITLLEFLYVWAKVNWSKIVEQPKDKICTAKFIVKKIRTNFTAKFIVKKIRKFFTAKFIVKKFRKIFTAKFIVKKIRKIFTAKFIVKKFENILKPNETSWDVSMSVLRRLETSQMYAWDVSRRLTEHCMKWTSDWTSKWTSKWTSDWASNWTSKWTSSAKTAMKLVLQVYNLNSVDALL